MSNPTATPVKPLLFGSAKLIIGADDFAGHIEGATFTPSTSSTSWTNAKGEVFTKNTATAWTLQLDYVQDWESNKSLSRYLFENEGKTASIKLVPADGSRAVTAVVSIAPGAIGGKVNSFGTATVTLGVTGKPVFSDN